MQHAGLPYETGARSRRHARRGPGGRDAPLGFPAARCSQPTVQAAPLRAKTAGLASFCDHAPWKPKETSAPGAMVPL